MNRNNKLVPRDWPDVSPISYQNLLKLHPVNKGMYVKNQNLISIQVVTPNKLGYNDFFFEDGTLWYAKSHSDAIGNTALRTAHRDLKMFSAYIGFKRFSDKDGNIKDEEIYEQLCELNLENYEGKIFKLDNLFISEIRDNYFLIKHVSDFDPFQEI